MKSYLLTKTSHLFSIMVTVVIVGSCSSPMELDVPRTRIYLDSLVNPTRMSLYYYYADSAWEAVYTDPLVLSKCFIDTGAAPFNVTIPALRTPKFACMPTDYYSTVVTSFSFSSIRQACDGMSQNCIGSNAYMFAKHKGVGDSISEHLWFADMSGRQIRIGYTAVPELRLVKGRINLSVIDPLLTSRFLSFNAILTIEY